MTSQPSEPAEAEARFNRGLGELDQYLFYFNDAALPRAVRAFRSATTLAPDNADAIERSRRTHDPEEWARQAEEERRACSEMQEELRISFDPDRVPAGLRHVAPWAIRLGVGDDVCRSWLAERLSASERSALLSVVREHATSVHLWLDTFGDKPMTTEAAAVMYLLLGVEEKNTEAF